MLSGTNAADVIEELLAAILHLRAAWDWAPDGVVIHASNAMLAAHANANRALWKHLKVPPKQMRKPELIMGNNDRATEPVES